MLLHLKRIYENSSKKDGLGALVDRLWPRGVTRKASAVDLWCKDIAPSNDLRKWFGHNPAKWDEFKRRYFKELDNHPDEISLLADKTDRGTVTLLFSAKDKIFNNAAALMEYIKKTRNK